MKTKLILLTLLLSTTTFADTILGFYAGANYWNYNMSGQINSVGNVAGNVNIDYSDDSSAVFYAALEHPIPFLPNIKLQKNSIQSNGIINISNISDFPGQSFDVNSDLDFSHTDIMLYYELLDNWVNLDFGLSFKNFDGSTSFIAQDVLNEQSQFNVWIPMLYAKGKIDLPFTGFSTSLTLEALSFDDNKVTDMAAAINYESDSGFGAEAGYRNLTIDLQSIGSLKSDISMDGFYLGVNFHF